MTDAKLIAEEIIYVYQKLEKLIKNLDDYKLAAKNPTWLPIEPGSEITVREKILFEFSSHKKEPTSKEDLEDLLLSCATSFDVDTNARNFQVDHFYPQDQIMTRIDQLKDPKELLKEIKQELLIKFTQVKGADKAKEIVDRLINDNNQDFDCKGLKTIYYNFPDNLWPLSPSTNTSKSDKDSVNFIIKKALKRAYVFGEEALFSIIKSELPHETLELGSIIKEKDPVIKKIKLISLSERISKQINDIFIASCPTYRQILPHILGEEANQRKFLSSFFLERQIGKACLSFAKETVKNARRTFSLANIITM